jgi:hypothetical protein
MAGKEYRSFIEAVETDLRRRGRSFEVADGMITFTDADAGADEISQAGLSNLAQTCHLAGPADWPELIAGHFDALLDGGDGDRAFETDFDAARPLLRPRLGLLSDYPPDAPMVRTVLGADLVAILVYDLPTTVRSVRREDADNWNVPIDELFAIARDNLATATDAPERVELPLPDDDGTLQGFHGPSFFTASELLRLTDHLPERVPNGVLVAVPNRHFFLFHPIVDTRAVAAVQAMLSVASMAYRDGPGSISPDLFWWHDGALTLLPSRSDRRSIDFFPPDAFVEVLNGLPAPER